MGICQGNLEDHCCYVGGVPCVALRDDGPEADRRWVCTLREAASSWAEVYLMPAYAAVRRRFDRAAPDRTWQDCGDFPAKGERCGLCGVRGA